MTRESSPASDAFVLGLDIGGTKSAAVLGDLSGTVLVRRSGLTPRGDWQTAVAFLISLVKQVCAEAGIPPADAVCLGVSCGGPVDTQTGMVYSPPNLPSWDAVPLRSELQNALDITKVIVENDANATALAEHRWGAGQGANNMAFLTMGTGIGAGLILDGKLYRGRGDLAGEIGHTIILPDGPLCLCGKRGCLEALASGTAIGRMGKAAYDDASVTAEIVCDRARAGDAIARGIIDRAAYFMGIGLANLLHMLNLERIVLGTLAVVAGDLLLGPIRESTKAHCWPHIWEGVEVVPAALGAAAQDMAALAVALTEVGQISGGNNLGQNDRVLPLRSLCQRV